MRKVHGYLILQLLQTLSHSSPSMEGSTSGKRDDGVGALVNLLACPITAAAAAASWGRRESEDGVGVR